MPITTLPFSGFYNTVHDGALDDALESVFQNDNGDIENPDILQRAQDATVWRIVQNSYAAEYTQCLAVEYNLPLVFESLKSPREYNFSTDIIYCTIAQEDVNWLFDTCDKNALAKLARETFTSRSGFVSFYSPDFEAWGETETWDHNQIGVLIRAHIADQNPDFDAWAEFDLMENARCNGALENWIFESNQKGLNRLSSVNDYLQTRMERA